MAPYKHAGDLQCSALRSLSLGRLQPDRRETFPWLETTDLQSRGLQSAVNAADAVSVGGLYPDRPSHLLQLVVALTGVSFPPRVKMGTPPTASTPSKHLPSSGASLVVEVSRMFDGSDVELGV